MQSKIIKFIKLLSLVISINVFSALMFITTFEYFFDKKASSPNMPIGGNISHVIIKNKNDEKASDSFDLSNSFISDKSKITKLANFLRENNEGWKYYSLVPMPSYSHVITLEGNGDYSLSIFLDSDGRLGVNDENGAKWKLLTREQIQRLLTIVR